MIYILILIGCCVLIQILLTAVNIIQNGFRGADGRTTDEILGIPSREARLEDVERLSKSEVMQLFFAAKAPEFAEMKGEYRAKLLPVGVMFFANNFYAHHLMGPGHWDRKAFFPFEKDKGWGYNLFSKGKGEDKRIIRTMKMDTFVGRSMFDKTDSFHLVYAAHNRGRNHSMHDEIRKINDRLFIAMGCLAWNLGALNPSPFVLYGEPDNWVGPDKN